MVNPTEDGKPVRAQWCGAQFNLPKKGWKRMKGKKILTLILAVVLAAGMLTACVTVPGSSAGVRRDT